MCNLQDQPLFKYDLQTDQWSLFTQNSPATYHPEGEASSSSRKSLYTGLPKDPFLDFKTFLELKKEDKLYIL